MQVKLIAKTAPAGDLAEHAKMAEDILVYCARRSNPNNGLNFATGPKLLGHCIDNRHWSVFDQADMTVEVVTSRAISAQIIRHFSLKIQEFSQRYAIVTDVEPVFARRQDKKNRQNSIDDLPEATKEWFADMQDWLTKEAFQAYNKAIEMGIAKECARFLLPLSSRTTLCMKGSVRTWIHYLQVRTAPDTQLEHRQVAEEIKKIFVQEFPFTAEALKWAE
jgi:thymidylate synthase (FAD)